MPPMPRIGPELSFQIEITRSKLFIKHPINVLSIFKVNPFLANVPILYTLKTPENRQFSAVIRGYKIGNIGQKWVKDTRAAY